MGGSQSDYGTFKDSRKAPIHGWFQYPAGYSYKLVTEKIKQHKIKPKDGLVFDPFLGTGTTCLAAMSEGYDSVGIEAHDFVSVVASTKLSWANYDIDSMRDWLWKIGEKMSLTSVEKSSLKDLESMPELVKKCYSEDNLRNLLKIKHAIRVSVKD